MTPVFADTGYWIALLAPGDSLHAKAVALTETLGRRTIVTSEMVLTEFLNEFSKRGEYHRTAAAQFVLGLRTQDATEIVPQTPEQFEAALDLYLRRPDKEWGLTDCASILICEVHAVTEVLAHDRHFAQAGLVALLRDDR